MKVIDYVKKHKKNVTTIATTLFAVLFVGYVLAHLFGGFSEKLKITPATVVTEEKYELHEAYIFRDEEVIRTDYSGYRLDMVEDGAMIGKGTEYARVYSKKVDEAAVAELETIDKTLYLLRACAVSLSPSAVQEQKQTALEIYKSILDLLDAQEVKLAADYRDELVKIYSTLSVYRSEGNSLNNEDIKKNIEELKKLAEQLEGRREEIVDSFGGDYQSLVSERTGFYYSGCDGYEELMSSDGISSKGLADILSAIDGLSAEATPDGQGRLVYDPNWYAAVVVDMKDAVKYIGEDGEAKGGLYSVGFFDGAWNDIEMSLERVVRSSGDARAVLIFSSADMNTGFDGDRHKSIRIHTESYSGYRVPADALRKDDAGNDGVYILMAGVVEWKKIEIVYADPDGGFVLVKRVPIDNEDAGNWLALNDSIIIGGSNLYDGKTVY